MPIIPSLKAYLDKRLSEIEPSGGGGFPLSGGDLLGSIHLKDPENNEILSTSPMGTESGLYFGDNVVELWLGDSAYFDIKEDGIYFKTDKIPLKIDVEKKIYKQPTEPTGNLEMGDLWIKNSVIPMEFYFYNATSQGWNPIGSGSGGGGVATITSNSINELMDVDTASTLPLDGQALVWDSSTNLWKPETQSATSTNKLTSSSVLAVGGEMTMNVSNEHLSNIQVVTGTTPAPNLATDSTKASGTTPRTASYPPSNAFDGNATTKFETIETSTSAKNAYLIYDFTEPKVINKMKITQFNSPTDNVGHYGSGLLLQGRNTDTDPWTTIKEWTGVLDSVQELPFTNTTAYRYLKLNPTNNFTTGYYWSVYDLQYSGPDVKTTRKAKDSDGLTVTHDGISTLKIKNDGSVSQEVKVTVMS